MSDDVVEARIFSDYLVPVSPGNDVKIVGPFPLSEPEWRQFMTVLDAMRPGLVATPTPEDSGGKLDPLSVRVHPAHRGGLGG